MDIIDLDENRPHIVVQTDAGAHVIPVTALERMATGSVPLIKAGQEREDEALLRQIIAEWLEFVNERG